MKRPDKQQIWLALSCVVSIILALCNTKGLEGTEFSGGWLTGPLLSMIALGTVLFALAFIVAFVFPRISAAIDMLLSLFCLSPYRFCITPLPFSPTVCPLSQF